MFCMLAQWHLPTSLEISHNPPIDGLLVLTVPASVDRSNQAAKAFSLIFDFSLIVIQELVKGGEELEGIKRRCCRCLCLLYTGTLEPRFRAAFLTCLHLLLLLGENHQILLTTLGKLAASKHVRICQGSRFFSQPEKSSNGV